MSDTNNTLAANSLVVGDDIRRLERSIQAAMRDNAQLAISILDTVQAASLSANVCHAALAPVTETFDGLMRVHQTAFHKAHRTLERVGGVLGLSETSWGGGEPKHAAVFTPRGEAVGATQVG